MICTLCCNNTDTEKPKSTRFSLLPISLESYSVKWKSCGTSNDKSLTWTSTDYWKSKCYCLWLLAMVKHVGTEDGCPVLQWLVVVHVTVSFFFNSIGFFTRWATLAEDLRFSRVDWGDDTTELGRPRFVIVEYCVLCRMLTNKHRTAIPAHPHIQDLSKRLILLLLQYRFDRVLPTSTILGQC